MTPFYQDPHVTLYCGDCREIAPSLPPCDAIVADPPYGETALDWDTWPAGWPRLMLPLAPHLWCFGSLRMFLAQRDDFAGWDLAQDIVWEKHNGSGMHNDRFRRVHELAAHFYRGPWGTLYKRPPVVTLAADRGTTINRSAKPVHWGDVAGAAAYAYDGRRIQRSVIPVRSCHGYAVNETQKPEGIVWPLLDYSVPPGGLVLDPFAGSGTTLAVARAQGKRAIGIELRPAQCAAVARRLAQADLALTETPSADAPHH